MWQFKEASKKICWAVEKQQTIEAKPRGKEILRRYLDAVSFVLFLCEPFRFLKR